ncbi:hypothetical protein FK531_12530 [Rhodococcus spelaei]|uniref:DUF8020 domain-containing protein n=1 Tax=Rhodococcus spelaei TaxID=2546320 RepID=A0A541B8K0_9NOCA|nr:hypothetical protein [Rhodococcus spelaei]TQF68636.1 hypothetical protein FK531_12530 [Rhodococcus spelaei]
MKMTKMVAVAAMTIASMGVVAGTAYADPAPAASPGVGWNVTRSGDKVIVDTPGGSLSNEDNHLVVRDASGATVESVPLSIAYDGVAHPIAAQIDGHTATLTADTAPAAATPVALPVKDIDMPAAVAAVKDPITLTGAVGGFMGAATGLVGGCLLGAVAAGVVSAPAAMLFGAGPIAGCIGGALLLGSGASLAGTAIGGLGGAAANAQQFITLLNAPPAKK